MTVVGAISDAEAAQLFADLGDAPAFILAVSGGPDSMALLFLVARWRARLTHGPRLLAVTVDHGLRPGSAAEARAVGRMARRLKVGHRIMRWVGAKPETGIQDAARTARLRFLAAAARKFGARHVLTAHTLDDQAETVLFRLARGSGLSGLAAMRRVTALSPPATRGAVRGRRYRRRGTSAELFLVRPFLDIPKARLIATLEAAGIPFVQDPSNLDLRFARARLRALMPALAAEGLDADRLALLARRAARADAAIEASVDLAGATILLTQSSDSRSIIMDAAGFLALPAEVAIRLLGRTIAQVGDEGPVELGKLEALFAALAGERKQGVERRLRLRRTLAGALVTLDSRRLTVERAPPRRRAIESVRRRWARTID